jgi:hypothetical protein
MHFSDEQLKELAQGYRKVRPGFEELMTAYVYRQWSNPGAREYATHGLSRRLSIMVRCIDNVFTLLPPELIEVPPEAKRTDAMIGIHAFVFNTFGCLDNFAWILVLENELTASNGRELRGLQVSLARKNSPVRSALSEDLRTHLESMGDWFEYQENYRHSLAHRIPLYIPPYTVDPKNEGKYLEYDRLMALALRSRDFREYKRLEAEKGALGTFSPLMQHSFIEGARPVVFHAQMLADFETIGLLPVSWTSS